MCDLSVPPPHEPLPCSFPGHCPLPPPARLRVTLAAAAAGHGPAAAGGNALAGVPPLASPAVALLPPPVAAASSSGAVPAAGANRVVALLSGWPPRLWRTGVAPPGVLLAPWWGPTRVPGALAATLLPSSPVHAEFLWRAFPPRASRSAPWNRSDGALVPAAAPSAFPGWFVRWRRQYPHRRRPRPTR